MTYRLKPHESLSTGIKRIATEQIEKAIKELSTADELGMDEAIHQARKRFKKIRAVIRLVRDRLGSEKYKQENARFRDLGRSLAGLRDAKVQIETLDYLTAHFADDVTPETLKNLRRELRVDYRREYQRITDEGVVVSVKEKLKDAKPEIDLWTIEDDDWSAIAKSLKRVYKRGYQGLHQANSEPTAENFHDWRKRVKYLRYQLRIVRPIWNEVIAEWIDRTHELSDYLGEDHDLAVLQEFAQTQPEKFDSDNLQTLTNLCDRRRATLQSAAIFLGKRIYTEKPKHFVNRLGNYWQIWQLEIKDTN
ncbi:MAG: CHAD domain-containing protein [Pleurocapsa sp.]